MLMKIIFLMWGVQLVFFDCVIKDRDRRHSPRYAEPPASVFQQRYELKIISIDY